MIVEKSYFILISGRLSDVFAGAKNCFRYFETFSVTLDVGNLGWLFNPNIRPFYCEVKLSFERNKIIIFVVEIERNQQWVRENFRKMLVAQTCETVCEHNIISKKTRLNISIRHLDQRVDIDTYH